MNLSITDRIDSLIAASKASVGELNNALRGFPAKLFTTVMGRDAPQIQQAKVNIYNRSTQDADLFDNVMTQFTGPDPVAAMYPACHAITRFCERCTA